MTGSSAIQAVQDARSAETRSQVPDDLRDTAGGALKTLGLLYIWDKSKRKKAVEAPAIPVVDVSSAPAHPAHSRDPKTLN
jgi:hypothetical protein